MNDQKRQSEDNQIFIERLRMSNKDFWDKLSNSDREAIIKKYHDLYDIKEIGVRYILDQNHNLRSSVYLLFIGMIFGLVGGAVSNIWLEYFSLNLIFRITITLCFVVLIIKFLKMVEKDLAYDLGRNKILENLLELVKKEDKK